MHHIARLSPPFVGVDEWTGIDGLLNAAFMKHKNSKHAF